MAEKQTVFNIYLKYNHATGEMNVWFKLSGELDD